MIAASFFRNLPLRRKQTLIILMTSSTALLLACSGFVVYDLIAFRESMVRRLSILAEILGENTSAALDFNEAKSAEETLSGLHAEPRIVGACVYRKSGEPFVTYDRLNDNIAFTPPAIRAIGHTFERQRLVLTRSIVNKGETIGVIYLESDTEELTTRLVTYAGISSLVFLASLLAALGLSNRLQGLVSEPILRLAQVAHAVALDRNYSVRAAKPSNDEIGQLVDGFNEMLAQIQNRDTALAAARDGLEKRVLERTEELEKEIVQRRKTEADRLKFFALVENSSDYISMTQLDGRVFYLNPAGRKMAGITLNADLASIDWREFYDESNWRLRCEVAIPKLLETGHWDGEIRMRNRLTGESRDLRVTGFRVDEPQTGTTLCMATVQYDITEQKEAERAITERARLMALSADIGSSLTRGASLRDMLQGCAEALVKHLDAAFARVWTLAEDTQVLELRASAGLYTHLDGPHGRVPVGKFKIGLIAQEKKPHLTNQVVGDPRVGDQEWAKREGMVAFAGYPLVVDDRVVGVMALFARHPLPDTTLQAMAGVADNVALGIERMRTHGALQLSEQRMRLQTAALESAANGVAITDRKGTIQWVNRSFTELTGYSAEEAIGQNPRVLKSGRHPDSFYAELWHTISRGNIWKGEIVNRRKDGRLYHEEMTITPVRNQEGEISHFVAIMQDISERRRVEEERMKFVALIENSTDFIGMAGLDGKPFYVNKAGREMVGLDGSLDVSSANLLDYYDAATGTLILRTVIPETLSIGHYACEGKLRHCRTRALIPVLIHSFLVMNSETHEPICLATVQRNITDIKDAEAQLEKTHSELLEVSRLAGMAEVATGVLHNVGNVLNSVNVSATMIAEWVRASNVGNLGKLSEMLREHEGDLPDFLQNDEKGRQIPAYLHALASHLAENQQDVLTELRSLEKNIDHIKEIVAMQQNYAKVSGVRESVGISEIVEDALRINAGTLVRHHLDVIRDFQTDPVVTVERSKILQILVNLIRNAKYACDESGLEDKLMTVRIESDAERVRIAIIDNGIGIPPENLTCIFSHGFTTRKSGHGFGLHSAALAAKELGGSLTARSDGPGKGAVFTLEIPNQPSALAV